jgi:DNA modification methylase
VAFCRAGAACYVAAPARPLHSIFANVLKELGVWRQTLNWVKDSLVLGRSDYHYRHEPIFYGWKEGAAHYFVDDRTQDTVWEIPRPRRSNEHPTMKPVALVERAITNSSRPGNIVCDPFGGSGTTLIAAEATGRAARLLELSPQYVDVIVKRWETATGKQATRG